MPERSRVIAPQSSALLARLESLRTVTSGRSFDRFRAEVKQAVVEGLTKTVLAGRDGMGRAMAPLAPSTLKRRKGSGPPLAPRGASSRVITTFRADWQKQGGDWVLRRSWAGFDSRRGFPIIVAHLQGVPSRNLPKRDVSQIPPAAWEQIKRFHRELIARALARKG